MSDAIVIGLFTIVGGFIGAGAAIVSASKSVREQRYYNAIDNFQSTIADSVYELDPKTIMRGRRDQDVLAAILRIQKASTKLCFIVDDLDKFTEDSKELDNCCSEFYRRYSRKKNDTTPKEWRELLNNIQDKAFRIGTRDYRKRKAEKIREILMQYPKVWKCLKEFIS